MPPPQTVRFPDSVFMMGCRYDYLTETVREIDRQKHLSVRNILDATPPVWVRVPAFAIGRRMVTNGDYLQFLNAADEGTSARLYDAPDVWRYVWNDLNMRVERPRVPFERTRGEIVEFEEDYTGTRGVIEAYITSLRFEIQRVMITTETTEAASESSEMSKMLVLRDRDQRTQVRAAPRNEMVQPAFSLLKYFLRGALIHPDEDLFSILSEKEQDLVRSCDSKDKAVQLLAQLIAELRKAYRQRVDKRYMMAFQAGHFPIEPLDFLSRLLAQVRKLPDVDTAIPLREVLYPRYWPSSNGSTGAVDFLGQVVPWEEQPVYGVTLYEAVAYTAWLSRNLGRRVALPTQAQYERASSWPVDEAKPDGDDLTLDPARKLIFPWQDHNPTRDFNYYFGKEGAELGDFYFRNKKKYEELLEDTARVLDEKTKILQLEGFGWQWTCERYTEDEIKFMRFQDADYPRWEARTCKLRAGDERVTVFDYQPTVNVQSPNYLLKGSADIVGGPGLTTRRYAANPLRAYANVGFRIVVPEDES